MLRRKNALLLTCLVLLGVALLAILLAGCGSDEETATTAAPATTATTATAATTATTATAATTATTAAAEKYTFTYVSWTQSSVKSIQQWVAMQAVAAEHGWEARIMDAQGMPDKMVPLLQNAVETGTDVIITEVFPPEQIAAGALAAKAAGIPIISCGGGLGDGVQAFWDNGPLFGAAVANYILEKIGNSGDILLLGYSPGTPATGRENGFRETLEKAGATFTIDRQEIPVPGEVEGGLKFAQAWLASHPEGKGTYIIFGTWDEPAIGAISALREAGRTDVYVFGVDGSPQGFQAIREGTMVATCWSDPEAVGVAVAEAIPQVVANGVSGDITIHEYEEPVMVDKSNVEQIIAENPYVLGSQQ